MRNSLKIGVVVLIFVIILLMISPSFIFSPAVTFIDTSLYSASANAVSVQTKQDFGSQEVMANFPEVIGKWQGSDYPVEKYLELLKADTILVRLYEPSTFSQPIFFSMVQSKTESSFHPPRVCFTAQGFQIQEEGKDNVAIKNTDWISGSSNITIPLNKIIVTKNKRDGTITERRLILFCYVKGNQFYSDTINMLQVDALVPIHGSYESTRNEEKDFLDAVIPLMFSPAQASNSYRPLILTFIGWKIPGYLLIAVLLLIPVGIMVWPRVKRKNSAKLR